MKPPVYVCRCSGCEAEYRKRRAQTLTPLDFLHRYWRQVSPPDRIRFLVEMLTPAERRALQFGFEDEELSP